MNNKGGIKLLTFKKIKEMMLIKEEDFLIF